MDLKETFLKVYRAGAGKAAASSRPPSQPLLELRTAAVTAVINQKGGCGKTTTSINLAACLAEMGYNVLLADLDPQAHATLGLGVQGDELELTVYHLLLRPELSLTRVLAPTYHRNLKLLPANGLLAAAQVELLSTPQREFLFKKKLEEVKDLFHFVFIDCPPSLNVLTLNALTAAASLLIPIQTQYYSLEGMRELFRTVELIRENSNPDLEILGILPTLFDGRTRINRAMLGALKAYFKEQLFETVVRLSAALAESPMRGQPVTQHAPGSRGSADYRKLAEEVLNRVVSTHRSVRDSKAAL